MLVFEHLKIAVVIALPASFFIPWYFAGAALLTLLTAWLTVGFQTLKASMANPTTCLQYE